MGALLWPVQEDRRPRASSGSVVHRWGTLGRERFDVMPGEYVLVTLHRPHNVDGGGKLAAIAEVL